MRAACGGDDRHSGWCHENGILLLPRWLAIAFTTICAALVAYVTLRTMTTHKRIFGAQQARCLFLLASFAAGPGLVANVVFKDNWGRARPREVVQYGGEKQFTPPLLRANQCTDNCSFISGEAAAVYVPFFAAALLLPHVRVALIIGGLVAGTTTGLVRMSTGGHFLSDILFAGIIMALSVSALHVLMISTWERRRASSAEALDWRSLLTWPLDPLPTGRITLEVK